MKMWYAKDRKIVYYPCANDTILNFVCIHPAHLSATSDGYDAGANKSQLLDVFSGFHKSILALLGKADPQTLKVYPLFDMDTLPTFIADRLALIGDAAHPFLPHLAQGGAMAIEDAVALGVMLGNNATRESVPDRLNMYNEARYERATRIQHYTRLVGGDGLDQKEEVDDFAREYKFHLTVSPDAEGLQCINTSNTGSAMTRSTLRRNFCIGDCPVNKICSSLLDKFSLGHRREPGCSAMRQYHNLFFGRRWSTPRTCDFSKCLGE